MAIRKFYLYDKIKSNVFNLSEGSVIVSEVSGLGNSFAIEITNHTVTKYNYNFEDISLTLNIGISNKPYQGYKELMNFINSYGKDGLIFTYKNDANINEYNCDVYVANVPRSQKNEFGILTETLVLKRLSPWYFFKNQQDVTAITVTNNSFLDIPVNIDFNSWNSNNPRVLVKDKSGNIVSTIRFIYQSDGSDFVITIDSESKKVTALVGATGEMSNIYGLIDKTEDCFIMIPYGTFTVSMAEDFNDNISEATWKEWVVE